MNTVSVMWVSQKELSFTISKALSALYIYTSQTTQWGYDGVMINSDCNLVRMKWLEN
jgi:hypothetical protein